MKHWPIKKLGDVAEFINGRAFKPSDWSSEGLPIIRIQNLTNPLADANYFSGKFDQRHAVEDGDLLVSWSATLDVFIWDRGDAVLNQHIFRVIPNSSLVLKSYFFYALKSVMDELRSKTHGATMKHITKGPFERTEIPVPPLAEQERIVKLLDEADELRKLRAKADRRTADLIPALFHEMFGDPAINSNRWPMHRLRELGAKFSDGPFGSNLKSSHYTPRGVRVIRLQNIGVGRLIDDDRAYISPKHFDSLHKHECLPGDVLVGTLGDPNLRACILPPKIPQALNKADCVQIRPNLKVATSTFICWLLNLPSTLEMASSMIHGQTRARISMGRLAELTVPVPPLQLQEEFSQRVAEIREMEAEQTASRVCLNALFQSLLHRAFEGEL